MKRATLQWVVVGSVLLGWSACGGDAGDDEAVQTETQQEMPSQQPPPREGPEGCYLPAQRRCDCAIQQLDCTEDVGVWTEGCASCTT